MKKLLLLARENWDDLDIYDYYRPVYDVEKLSDGSVTYKTAEGVLVVLTTTAICDRTPVFAKSLSDGSGTGNMRKISDSRLRVYRSRPERYTMMTR